MSMYNADKLPVAIPIGVQTETGVEEIVIDVSSWLAKWPDMVCSIHHTRPGETDSYPVVTTLENGVIIWHVNETDTALQGVGTMEVLGLTPDEKHRKLTGAWCSTVIKDSTLDESGEVPEAARPWVDQVMLAADQALSATQKMPSIGENGTWMVWDAAAGEYVDTGKPSKGKDGQDGYTPIKGKDYWTEADRQSMVDDVIAALPEGGLGENVTEETNTYTRLLSDLENAVEDLPDDVGFETDKTLTLENGVLSVNTTDEATESDIRPITSQGVYAEFAVINALLKTI